MVQVGGERCSGDDKLFEDR